MSSYRESALREMGLAPLWRLRARDLGLPSGRAAVPSDGQRAAAAEANVGRASIDLQASARAPIPMPRSDRVRAHSDASRADRSADAANTPDRVRPETSAEGSSNPPDGTRAQRIATLDWEALEADMRGCRACRLCEQRTQAVPGVGDRQAEWMLVGEGPGAEEDRRGEPFVGAAGQLLDAMLAAIGLSRDHNVYIANAVKCRPPMNRTPEADEIDLCRPYLRRQIALVQPRLVLAMGRPAATSLLGQEVKINAARGRVFHVGEIPVVVTYHPAYLLRNQSDKRRAWEDLCFARKQFARGGEAS